MRRTRPHTDQCTNRKKLPLDSWPQTQDYYQLYFSPIYSMFIFLFLVSLNVEILIFYTAFFLLHICQTWSQGTRLRTTESHTYVCCPQKRTYIDKAGGWRGSGGRWREWCNPHPLHYTDWEQTLSALPPQPFRSLYLSLNFFFFFWQNEKLSNHKKCWTMKPWSPKEISPFVFFFFFLLRRTHTDIHANTHLHTHTFPGSPLPLPKCVPHLKAIKYKNPCQKKNKVMTTHTTPVVRPPESHQSYQ